jgi:membrane protease subunit HflK
MLYSFLHGFFIFYMTFKNPWDDISAQNEEKSKSYSQFDNNHNLGKNFNFKNFEPKKFLRKSSVLKIICIVIGIWLATGFYIVKQEERAIVLRFGRYVRNADAGLHYSLPYPFELVIKEAVTRIRILKVGEEFGQLKSANNRLTENLMLTGDENIVDLAFEVQWRIKNLQDFIFNVREKEITIEDSSQSAIREVIGKTKLAAILTNARSAIEEEAKSGLQKILDSYNFGVEITLVQMLRADPPTQVIDSFRDVQTARVDKESTINKAYAYENNVIPNAIGEAGKINEDAESYAVQKINKAKGDSLMFSQIYDQYRLAPYVTRKRLYLEAMEDLFKNGSITVVDDSLKSVVFIDKKGNSEQNAIAQAALDSVTAK